jgi:hypothetical protein
MAVIINIQEACNARKSDKVKVIEVKAILEGENPSSTAIAI